MSIEAVIVMTTLKGNAKLLENTRLVPTTAEATT
jgi:hypothetical protein